MKLIINVFSLLAVIFSVMLAAPVRANADNCNIPQNLRNNRPDADGMLTRVAVGIYVIDVKAVDDVKQTFSADIHGALTWQDRRLSAENLGASLENCKVKLGDIWHPHINIINSDALKKFYEDIAEIDSDGNVIYRQRFTGAFSSHVDLRDFPFDTQKLHVSLASFRYGPEDITLVFDDLRSGRVEKFSVAGWSIETGETRVYTQYIKAQDRELSRMDYQLIAKRHEGFYLWKVLLPLGLIVFMASTVFWIDPHEVGAQVGISTASVLTLIAFQFSLGYLLPRVSYFTRADKFIFGSTLLVFFALAEAILTSRLAKIGKVGLSYKIDRWARFIYLSLFVLIIIYMLLIK